MILIQGLGVILMVGILYVRCIIEFIHLNDGKTESWASMFKDIFIPDLCYSKCGSMKQCQPTNSLFLVCDETNIEIVSKCLELLQHLGTAAHQSTWSFFL